MMHYLQLTVVVSLMLIFFHIYHAEESDDNAVVEYAIEEELAIGTVIGNLLDDAALRPAHDSEDIRQMRFRILPSGGSANSDGDSQYIGIVGDSGIVKIRRRIDRDTICYHQATCILRLDVIVHPERFFRVITLYVRIIDINDNSPEFSSDNIFINVSESSHSGMEIRMALAEDIDSSTYDVKRYFIQSIDPIPEFKLSRTTNDGNLYLLSDASFDYESRSEYHLTLWAVDGGAPPRSGSVSITINVGDVNDNAPSFSQPIYVADVSEYTSVSTKILTVVATDLDSAVFSTMRYEWSVRTMQRYGDLFKVDSILGHVTVIGQLDYEISSTYQLTVVAHDAHLSTEAVVEVRVHDENDNAPDVTLYTMTSLDATHLSVPVLPRTVIAYVITRDRDSGSYGDVICRISNGSDFFSLVGIQEDKLKIVTSTNYTSWQVDTHYMVCVVCADQGQPPLSTTKCLNVSTRDGNQEAPRFDNASYYSSISENNSKGAFVLKVKATDSDPGVNGYITYHLEDIPFGVFSINANTGIIRALIVFDYEQQHEWKFRVVATDGSLNPKSTTAAVILNIINRNDEKPMFLQSAYVFTVIENSPIHSTIGRVVATDGDLPPFNIVRYTIIQQDRTATFSLNRTTGVITTRAQIDREQKHQYRVVVSATNPGSSFTVTTVITVHVVDENDNPPIISYPNELNNTVRVGAGSPANTTVRIQATDKDAGDNAILSFAIDGIDEEDISMFSIHPRTGVLVIDSHNLTKLEQRFTLHVLVQDNGGLQSTAVLYVDVINATLTTDGSKHTAAAVACTICVLILIFCIAIICRFFLTGSNRHRLISICHSFRSSVEGGGPNHADCYQNSKTARIWTASGLCYHRNSRDPTRKQTTHSPDTTIAHRASKVRFDLSDHNNEDSGSECSRGVASVDSGCGYSDEGAASCNPRSCVVISTDATESSSPLSSGNLRQLNMTEPLALSSLPNVSILHENAILRNKLHDDSQSNMTTLPRKDIESAIRKYKQYIASCPIRNKTCQLRTTTESSIVSEMSHRYHRTYRDSLSSEATGVQNVTTRTKCSKDDTSPNTQKENDVTFHSFITTELPDNNGMSNTSILFQSANSGVDFSSVEHKLPNSAGHTHVTELVMNCDSADDKPNNAPIMSEGTPSGKTHMSPSSKVRRPPLLTSTPLVKNLYLQRQDISSPTDDISISNMSPNINETIAGYSSTNHGTPKTLLFDELVELDAKSIALSSAVDNEMCAKYIINSDDGSSGSFELVI